MQKLITIAIAFLAIENAQACDNNCWLNANASILVANAQYFHDHPDIALIVDEICEQGLALTQQQINISNRFGFHNPQECRRATPTPTSTPMATATATVTPTATATLTPRPTATPRPSPSSTPHVSPTRSPRISPTPTPTAIATATATPTPTATATPTVTPTTTATVPPTPTPSATATSTPSSSPTPTPQSPTPTPTSTSTPTITPSPSCTPHGNCTKSTIEWAALYPNWPASAFPLQLGNHVYTKQQSYDILTYPGFPGDGLNPLCREMVAARLNIANGSGHECVDGFLEDADVEVGNLIPKPIGDDTKNNPDIQNLIFHLTRYNKGEECCAAHCQQSEESK